MMIRDAAVTEQVPRLSRRRTSEPLVTAALVYNLGHAAFEFIEARYGKEGIRQFLYTLRKNIVGGGMDDIYQQAFRIKPEEFDEAFDEVAEGALQALPRQAAAQRLRQATSRPNPEKTRLHPGLRASPQPLGRGGGGPHRQPRRKARPTSSCSRPGTAACSRT